MGLSDEEIIKSICNDWVSWLMRPFGECTDYQSLAQHATDLWQKEHKRYSDKRLNKLNLRLQEYIKEKEEEGEF